MKYRRVLTIAWAGALGACASNPVPPPSGAHASFDPAAQAIQITVSNARPPRDAALVSGNGTHYPVALTFESRPHVNDSAPPDIGLPSSSFGSGDPGYALPLGGPRPYGIDDQYTASAKFGVPADYDQNWASYHLEVHVGPQQINLPAPPPTAS